MLRLKWGKWYDRCLICERLFIFVNIYNIIFIIMVDGIMKLLYIY